MTAASRFRCERLNRLAAGILAAAGATAFFIRWHNLWHYNTLWADDGGAHLEYVRSILATGTLPTFEQTYLAWHEPLYYFLVSGWAVIGSWFGAGVNWWESLNLLIFFAFGLIIWLLTLRLTAGNVPAALANVWLYSILFVTVKLSAYVNNELLAQTLMLLLLYLFWSWRLMEPERQRYVFWWAVILALAALVKITVWIVLMAALITWSSRALAARKSALAGYCFLSLGLALLINAPWIYYKTQVHGTYFTINIYDEQPKQNIFRSDGWQYLRTVRFETVLGDPYWFSEPHSFWAILAGDIFADYYNLFNDYVYMETLPDHQRILIDNGRYTTPFLWQRMLAVQRVGLFIGATWVVGFIGWLCWQRRRLWTDGYTFFTLIALFGGWAAAVFHLLRLPYPEAGIVKAHFILFTFPILSALAYKFWWQVLQPKKWLWLVVAVLPLAVYLAVAWPVLMIST